MAVKSNYIKLTVFFTFCSIFVYGQRDSIDVLIEKSIETYIENNDISDFDFNTTFENIYDLYDHPLNLNKATNEELSQLFFLTPIQILNIISYRKEYGDFISLEELQSVNSLDMQTIRLLLPFIRLNAGAAYSFNFKELLASGKSTLYLKYKRILQQRNGFIEDEEGVSQYKGSPDHLYTRYRFDAGKSLRAGITMEKDPGEEFFRGSNKKGFDFYSGFIHFEKVNPIIEKIEIGDFNVSMGQGLILHNSFGGGKSAYVTQIKKDGNTLRPYSSVNESNYFRGVGVTLNATNNVSTSVFYSSKKLDGTLVNDSIIDTGFGAFSSIIRNGFHRTETEIAKRGSVIQNNYGGSVKYQGNNFSISLNHLTYDFSKSLESSFKIYRLNQFRGDLLRNTSVDYDYFFRNINLFGEISTSSNGGIGQIHTLLSGLNKNMDLAFSYRNFGVDYQVLEANAFSEASLPINEEAFYLGIDTRFSTKWKLATFIDFWKSKWLKYRIDAPSEGVEAFARLEYVKKRKFNFYVQYKYEQKEINSSLNIEKIDPVISQKLHRLRLHMTHKVSPNLELRNRVEGSLFNKESQDKYGFLMYTDIIYKPVEKPYSFTFRYSIFDINDFNARIYTYENDILYEYAIPAFNGKGTRYYLKARYRINRRMSWEVRYSNQTIENAEALINLGSGSLNDVSSGNKRSEIKTQLKISF